MVCCRIRIQPKLDMPIQTVRQVHIANNKIVHSKKVQHVVDSLQKEILLSPQDTNAQKMWEYLRDMIHSISLLILGKKHGKRNYWFHAYSYVMTLATEAKNTVLDDHKWALSQRTLLIFRATRNKVQQTARQCANDYWLHLQ